MSDYAIVHNNVVTNVVVADDPTLLSVFIPDADAIIQVTAETRDAYIGGDIHDGQFRPPRLFPSWVWNDAAWSWDSPVPYPDDDAPHLWDEGTAAWVPVPGFDPED